MCNIYRRLAGRSGAADDGHQKRYAKCRAASPSCVFPAGTRSSGRRSDMRVMIIIKATKNSEAGVLPSPELLQAMGQFNQELAKAGVLLGGDGLQPTSKGKRVHLAGGKRVV